MLRSIKYTSYTISMVVESFRRMGPYIIVVAVGVFAFGAAFMLINQIMYIKSTMTGDPDDVIEAPSYSDIEVRTDTAYITLMDMKQKWLGEYIGVLKEQFIGSIGGFGGDGTELYSDT